VGEGALRAGDACGAPRRRRKTLARRSRAFSTPWTRPPTSLKAKYLTKYLVRISTLKHWELSAWYEKESEATDNLSPREYLQGKSFAERRSLGLMGLRAIGVLK
jgi:hypothetical protein